jgi:sigma-B regulation protein RsbU (phosphoserine phosphatase)
MPLTDAQRRIAELTTLHALAQTLNRALDVREAVETALPHIVELMGLRTGWVFLRDETSTFRLAARHELPPAIIYPGPAWADECDCQDLCLQGKLSKAVNIVHCSRLRHAIGDKRSLAQHASVPLINGEDVLGILNVATTAYGRFNESQLQLLSAIGFLLGTAIARAYLYDQVKVRRVQEQAALLNLAHDLLGAESFELAVQRLVRVGARMIETEACAYIEADEQAGCARLIAAHGWHYLPPSGLPLILDPANPHLWYLPENSINLAIDALDTLPALLKAQHFRSHLAVTVEIGGAPIGILMVNSPSQRRFLVDEVQLLGILATQLAQTVERERLNQESHVRQRLEQELDLARTIQASFLPDSCPTMPGYRMVAFYRAARQVGGDFYDFIALGGAAKPPEDVRQRQNPGLARRETDLELWRSDLPDDYPGGRPITARRVGLVIADVTDKGVPAALFMVLSRTLIRATASDGRSPAAVLEQANQLILADARSGLFVTCFYGILDADTHTLCFANGGHNYPLLYRAATGEVVQLQALGIVLGIIPNPRFAEAEVHLQPGDVLCLYTDGITEAMNTRRQLFDEERLMEVLRHTHYLPPEQIVRRILDAVSSFSAGAPQNDDITMVVIKRDAA